MENNVYYISKNRCTVITPVDEGIDDVQGYYLGISRVFFVKKGTSVICGTYKDTAIDDGVLVTFFDHHRKDEEDDAPFTILYDRIVLKKVLSEIERKNAKNYSESESECSTNNYETKE